MDDKEIQKQLEDQLAARDIAEVNTPKNNKVPDSVELEGFVLCSG